MFIFINVINVWINFMMINNNVKDERLNEFNNYNDVLINNVNLKYNWCFNLYDFERWLLKIYKIF